MYIIYLEYIVFAPDSAILEEHHTPYRSMFFVYTGGTKYAHYWTKQGNISWAVDQGGNCKVDSVDSSNEQM